MRNLFVLLFGITLVFGGVSRALASDQQPVSGLWNPAASVSASLQTPTDAD